LTNQTCASWLSGFKIGEEQEKWLSSGGVENKLKGIRHKNLCNMLYNNRNSSWKFRNKSKTVRIITGIIATIINGSKSMVDILVRPAELRQIASQMRNSANKIGQALQSIDSDIQSLKGDKFLGNRANAVQSHYQAKRDALQRAKELVLHFSTEIETAAGVFEQADRGQSNTGVTQAANPDGAQPNTNNISNEVFKFLDEWTKPINWIAEHKSASKQFHELFKELGRVFNDIGNTRGYVSKMNGLAGIFEGSAKGISVLGDLSTLHDFQRFFSGEITNSEVLRSAISAIPIPIPGLSDYITDKLLPYLPDPNGKWHGFITEVQ